MKSWFRFQNATEDASTVDIHILDVIGDWVDEWVNVLWGENLTLTAKAFVDQLAALPATVKALRVHINSPGGDVQAGVTIANALRDQQLSKGRTVETIVDGLAASSASVIAMAGSVVRMADNALMMIHNPYSAVVGNAAELRKSASILDTVGAQIVATYQWHSALDDKAIGKLMDAETWMTADEAIANGFATDKVEGLKAAALLSPKGVARLKVPDQYKARVDGWLEPKPKEPETPKPAEALAVMRACREAGVPDLAEALVAEGATDAQVTERVAAAKAAKAAADARETEVRALCAAAKLPELADGYVRGGMAVADIRVQLTTVTAKLDKVEIDGHLTPDSARTGGGTPINIAAIYAARNAKQKE